MCRLYGFISNEPTKVDCSLVYSQNALMQQSRADQVGLDHTDGWGIATYQDGQPCVRKKMTAAYDDLLFSTAAEKAYSTAIIAHVRRATVGVNSLENTHPFLHQLWTFAHNGTVAGFERLRPELESETDPELQKFRVGQTDSEQYFYWLLTRLKEQGLNDENIQAAQHAEVVQMLTGFVAALAERCEQVASKKIPRLNFVLTNGRVMMACRWNHSLFRIVRRGLYECEICGIPHIHHHETVNHRAIAVASEPVTHEAWEEVPNHSVLFVDESLQLVA